MKLSYVSADLLAVGVDTIDVCETKGDELDACQVYIIDTSNVCCVSGDDLDACQNGHLDARGEGRAPREKSELGV